MWIFLKVPPTKHSVSEDNDYIVHGQFFSIDDNDNVLQIIQ